MILSFSIPVLSALAVTLLLTVEFFNIIFLPEKVKKLVDFKYYIFNCFHLVIPNPVCYSPEEVSSAGPAAVFHSSRNTVTEQKHTSVLANSWCTTRLVGALSHTSVPTNGLCATELQAGQPGGGKHF